MAYSSLSAKPSTAILHYSAPPVVGGVEAVIEAHARVFLQMGYPVSVIAGRGEQEALPVGTGFELIPNLDSQAPDNLAAGSILERGEVPSEFTPLTNQMIRALTPLVGRFDNVIVHNVFTKQFNLPMTAAIFHLLDAGAIHNCIAWHHDFTWTSARSRPKVHPGYPWDLLRTYRPDVTHVTISRARQLELAGLYHCPPEEIRVIYNGVEPEKLFGLTDVGWQLVQRLDLFSADLVLLMPVRVTQAKNIEYALHVVAALKESGQKVKLILTGPPDPHDEKSMDYFHALQALRDQLRLKEEMHFVFEAGEEPDDPHLISLDVVADLYRVADLMFMPSRREGFGMPVLEAGLLKVPAVVSDSVPAAEEIGGEHVIRFALDLPSRQLAQRILAWAEADNRLQLARQVRQRFTWQSIFRQEIEPMLTGFDSQ